MQLRDERSDSAPRIKRESGNFGNAASRVRGGEAAAAARPIGLKGKVAAAKNEAAWGRMPEDEKPETKRERAWKGNAAATKPRSEQPAGNSQERDAKPARGSKIPRGATNPYSPYTASNGRKDNVPKDGSPKRSSPKNSGPQSGGSRGSGPKDNGGKRNFAAKSSRKK
jgi:hypothetical protein